MVIVGAEIVSLHFEMKLDVASQMQKFELSDICSQFKASNCNAWQEAHSSSMMQIHGCGKKPGKDLFKGLKTIALSQKVFSENWNALSSVAVGGFLRLRPEVDIANLQLRQKQGRS